ncbi:MAG: hypothetical protein FJW37_06790, partial [Acidobacteria bacterium]|nr:hypothetical protein [Acidobacteriota bacterium]
MALPASTGPAGIVEEGDLVAQSRAGDQQAFTELVRRYQSKIYRLALHITQTGISILAPGTKTVYTHSAFLRASVVGSYHSGAVFVSA